MHYHAASARRARGAAACAALLLALTACAEMPTSPEALAPPGHPTAVISPNVDLDATDLTLYYQNIYGTTMAVTPPWGSAVQVYAPQSVRFDHATADGWVVVYNTFDPSRTNSRPVLVLYNKYRGILRWWWFNDQDAAGPSNYLTYALMIDGNNTSAMNFVGEFAKDYTVRSSHPFVVQSNNAQFNSGLLSQTWYYFDTEMAYDPQIAGQSQQSFGLALNAWATSVSKLKLTGDINGTIDGTINGSGQGVTLFGSVIGSIVSTKYQNSTTVISNGPSAQTSLSDKVSTAVSSGLADAIKSSLNQLATQGLKLATSPLSNLFGSLISSKESPQQRVNLSLAAKLTASGDITTDQPAIQWVGALPGTQRGDLSGYVPYYNETMGLFNLAAPPIIRWRVVTGLYPPAGSGQKDVQYFAVNPTIVVNPAVASEVTISNVLATPIYIKQYSGQETFYNPNYLASTALSNFPVVNNLYGNVWYGFSAPYAIRYDWWQGTPEPNVVVKLSFTVTPNNGAAPVEIVKFYHPTYQPY